MRVFFFFNDTATTEIYTLSLHDALPIFRPGPVVGQDREVQHVRVRQHDVGPAADLAALLARRVAVVDRRAHLAPQDRKSTRLNSSHANISYAVFCLKKKKSVRYVNMTPV